jgi:Ni,Fe-hydrogenase III small subunit/ferredoxin
MIGILRTRLRQGYRTMNYPSGPPPELPARFAGRPVLDTAHCGGDCRACMAACPTGALAAGPDGHPRLDTGLCIFCRACEAACPHQSIRFSRDFRLTAAARDDLLVADTTAREPSAYNASIRKLFGRSLKLREVSAGGCNACEADTNVLNTLAWDLGRFGIQFVASPRHADGLLITGPVTRNMEPALRKTYEAVPAPKIVIAVGACAISGGLYRNHAAALAGAETVVPVDLFVPGCPPHPLTILDGLLRLLGKSGASGRKEGSPRERV